MLRSTLSPDSQPFKHKYANVEEWKNNQDHS